tara:strand:+ start:227 stop:550 length:324 start_codon:yes stop_codon:yes gene_type:complete
MTNDYAIIATGGKQYRVREGDTVEIEKVEGDAGANVMFDRVLLSSLSGNVTVGTPIVKGAKVIGEISSQEKAKKVTVFRYKNKTRRRTKNGHRQRFTSVKITGIEVQ